MLNIDVLAPMPSPSVTTAMKVKPGERRSDWVAKRRSFMTFSSNREYADLAPGVALGHISLLGQGLYAVPDAHYPSRPSRS